MGEILGHSPHPAFIKLKSFCWNNCFYNFGWISQVKSGWNLPDFMGEIHHFSWWNLVDFMKSLVIAPTLHSSNWRVFAETLAFIILGGFHRWNLGEIHQISPVKSTRFQGEIHQISGWNPPDFKGEIPHPAFIKLKSFCWNTCFYNFGWISQVKSTRFHRWNPPDFKVKSPTLHSSNWRVFAETLAFIILGGFHRWYLGEIRWISGWNPPDFTDFTDFMKSAGFHGWNPPDFTDFTDFMKSGGFHEIRRISPWNPPDFTDFMKSARFHEIRRISRVKSAGFHGFYGFHEIRRISWNPPDFTGWNPPDFTDFTDFMKSAGFHGWNPPDFTDFMKSVWNPPDFMNVSFWVMIKYRSFYRKTKQEFYWFRLVLFKEFPQTEISNHEQLGTQTSSLFLPLGETCPWVTCLPTCSASKTVTDRSVCSRFKSGSDYYYILLKSYQTCICMWSADSR